MDMLSGVDERTSCPYGCGMDKLTTFRDLIDTWPDRTTFAEDIGKSKAVVDKYAQGRPIPADRFQRIVRAAKKRGILVTAEDLVKMAAPADDTQEDAA